MPYIPYITFYSDRFNQYILVREHPIHNLLFLTVIPTNSKIEARAVHL